jgi:uncharacterized CHY-type Zn-finger protein
MCKHKPNAQVSIRAACCKKWFDCTQCHTEVSKHELLRRWELIFACKKCKKVFKKDLRDFEEQDEFCPYCDNHFTMDAADQSSNTPETPAMAMVQSDDPEYLRQQFGNVVSLERRDPRDM